jgi:hypothetical protein
MHLADSAFIKRRHFVSHLAAGAAALPTLEFLSRLETHAAEVKKNQRACILIWLGGGPPTIDMWDMKPGSRNGGEFKPISTRGNLKICEHLPKMAGVMDQLSVVRSMSTREADHGRGRYYLHTAYVPNPTVVHPTFGSVVSHQLGSKRADLEIPAFISIGGDAGSAGFLGMGHAPFAVSSNGQIRNTDVSQADISRYQRRLAMLDVVETNFIKSERGESPQAHRDVYTKAVNLMTSEQMRSFKIDEEKPEVREAFGNNGLGRGLLMARRLVETGVPFVEVNMGGWDLHSNVFATLRDQRLPILDQGLSALVADLKQRGLFGQTTLVCMGEFGRTPRINQNSGRDHWAGSWSVLLGGGGLIGGQAIGGTDANGTSVDGKSYLPGDIWATVAHTLGIPLSTVFQSKRGRPMKIANGGKPVEELIG